MRIITVNLPVSFLEAIEKLVGEHGLYPSRSELIRVAVRDFLIRELAAAKSFQQYQLKQSLAPINPPQKLDEHLFVQVPKGDGSEEMTTYKLVQK